MKYEICYLIGESQEAKLQKIRDEVEKMVIDAGGKFSDVVYQDKRKLAYKISKDIKGTYIARQFTTSENIILELTKKLNLYPNILRFIFVKAEDLPELKPKEEISPAEPVEKKKSGAGTKALSKMDKSDKDEKEKKIKKEKIEPKKETKEDLRIIEKNEDINKDTEEKEKKTIIEKSDKIKEKKEKDNKEYKDDEDDKKKEIKKESKKKDNKKTPSDDDIDQKLEEILNI